LLTPLSIEVAADYNARGVCGLSSGWFVYNPREITSLECEPVVGLNLLGRLAHSIQYDIIKVDDTESPTKLYFGDPRSGSGDTNITRPTRFIAEPLFKE
jgi:hypothetical protein